MKQRRNLPFYLIPSSVYKPEKKYFARTLLERTVDLEGLIHHMTGRNTTVARQEIIAVMDLLKETVKQFLLDEYVVDLGMLSLRCNIKGLFDSEDELFNKKKHKVHIAVTINIEIKGINLLLDWEKPDCGVFIIARQKNREPSFRYKEVIRKTDRTIVVRIPKDLPADAQEYRIVVQKQYFEGIITRYFNEAFTLA
jgi:hypothetical protein